MDANTGEIHRFENQEQLEKYQEAIKKRLIPLTEEEAEILKHLPRRVRKNNMRNKPCICGSGKKFKKCCWGTFA